MLPINQYIATIKKTNIKKKTTKQRLFGTLLNAVQKQSRRRRRRKKKEKKKKKKTKGRKKERRKKKRKKDRKRKQTNKEKEEEMEEEKDDDYFERRRREEDVYEPTLRYVSILVPPSTPHRKSPRSSMSDTDSKGGDIVVSTNSDVSLLV